MKAEAKLEPALLDLLPMLDAMEDLRSRPGTFCSCEVRGAVLSVPSRVGKGSGASWLAIAADVAELATTLAGRRSGRLNAVAT